jgi:ferredoxin-fold anticodon binding domain-containing protein
VIRVLEWIYRCIGGIRG